MKITEKIWEDIEEHIEFNYKDGQVFISCPRFLLLSDEDFMSRYIDKEDEPEQESQEPIGQDRLSDIEERLKRITQRT